MSIFLGQNERENDSMYTNESIESNLKRKINMKHSIICLEIKETRNLDTIMYEFDVFLIWSLD